MHRPRSTKWVQNDGVSKPSVTAYRSVKDVHCTISATTLSNPNSISTGFCHPI